jgi:hypothetical protein
MSRFLIAAKGSLLAALFLAAPIASFAQTTNREAGEPDVPKKELFALPYVFYSGTYDLGFGAAAASAGYGQEQLLAFTTLAGSVNGSLSLYSIIRGAQAPFLRRLFIDSTVRADRFTEMRSYVDGNPEFAGQRAGSEESSPRNFLLGRSISLLGEAKFRFVLPLGDAVDSPVHIYVTDKGLLKSGSTGTGPWNPLRSGRTYLVSKLFYRSQSFGSKDDPNLGRAATDGFAAGLDYHHEDFESNPTRGSRQRLMITRDPGLAGSSGGWTGIEGEISKYLNLGGTEKMLQRVLAFDVWTAATAAGRSPYYSNACLGGMDRLRAFNLNRFHDSAALYYSAEYRFIPRWMPESGTDVGKAALGLLRPDWWQTVVFGELGSVAPRWDFARLNSRMKWDLGLGIRARSRKIVLRCDSSFGSEGGRLLAGVTLLAGQPF